MLKEKLSKKVIDDYFKVRNELEDVNSKLKKNDEELKDLADTETS